MPTPCNRELNLYLTAKNEDEALLENKLISV